MMRSLLNLLHFILENLIESQTLFFHKKHYHLFDPHIGENGCQLRALQLLLCIKNSPKSLIEFECQLDYFRERELFFIQKIAYYRDNPLNNHASTLINFLKESELFFLLNLREKYIFVCYFLTKYKNTFGDHCSAIDYARVAHDAGVSQKLAKKLVHYYQVALTDFGCHTVVRYARELGYSYQYVDFLKKNRRKDDDQRSQLPCYFLTEVIIAKLKEERIPILIVLRNTHATSSPKLLYFYFNWELKSYRYLPEIGSDQLDQACFVIQAETEHLLVSDQHVVTFIKKIEQKRLSRILLSYMARHPQYSGKNLSRWKDDLFDNADTVDNAFLFKRFTEDKKLADVIGCTCYNKSFFFIQHIFCDTYRHQRDFFLMENDIYAFRENLTCWESMKHVL